MKADGEGVGLAIEGAADGTVDGANDGAAEEGNDAGGSVDLDLLEVDVLDVLAGCIFLLTTTGYKLTGLMEGIVGTDDVLELLDRGILCNNLAELF